MQVRGKNRTVDVVDSQQIGATDFQGNNYDGCCGRCQSVVPVTSPSIQRAFDQKQRPVKAELSTDDAEDIQFLRE